MYDVDRLIEDFGGWIFTHDYTYRQVRGMTGISESVICNLLNRKAALSSRNLFAICRAMGRDASTYILGSSKTYESLSIEELNYLLKQIRAVRDKKLNEKIKELEGEIDNCKTMLEEDTD